jgi:hypothetical protein
MDCARFEELLFAGMDADLEPVEREQMALHEQGCARCRRLAELVAGNEDPAQDVTKDERVADEITAAVVARTSGRACEQAAALLAETIDEHVGGTDDLLRLHLASCPDCAALERALMQLRRAMPALAEADPGPHFVSSVLAATLGRDVPTAARDRRAPARTPRPMSPRVDLSGLWQRLARRPRLALEGSYVVTMLLLLVFGPPTWSAAESPVQAFDGWWRERTGAARELIESAGASAQRGLESLWNENESDSVEPDTAD